MKWIGQSITDFIARFRSDVYLESIADHGSDPDRFLTMDSSTGKVTYRTGSEVFSDIGAAAGDITAVVAGTNLTGGATSGSATINLADASTSTKGAASFASTDFTVSSGAVRLVELTTSHLTASTLITKSEGISSNDNDTTLPTSAAVKDYSDTTGLQHFKFIGFGTGDGTNYEVSQDMTDPQSPFEHNTSIGEEGATPQTVQTIIRLGGTVMPRAGILKKWTGWATCAGSGSTDIALFKITPTRNTSSLLSLEILDNTNFTALGNAKMEDWDETSFIDASVAEGDIIITGVKAVNNKTFYFSSTLEILF